MSNLILNEDSKIATRESFGEAIMNLGDDVVVLDADLYSSTKTNKFKEKYPNRFFEVGIAEQDLIGTASGLATSGKIPFATGFAAFITGRCYDQIRCSISYSNLNVKIVGTHSGLTVGEDGATHQMLEDINLMRGLPNMVVLSPADNIETKALIEEAYKYNGPVYVRLSREKTAQIYNDENEKFEIGKSKIIGEGKDITVFSTGDILANAINAARLLEEEGLSVRVCDLYSIKPIDKETIIKCAKESKILVSVEDHNTIGGLGSAISEILTDNYPAKLLRIGINDSFGKSGTSDDLIKLYKLDAESIANQIKIQL